MLYKNLDKSNSDVLFEELYTYKGLDKHSFIKLYISKNFIMCLVQ